MNPLVTNGIGMLLVVFVLVFTGWHFGNSSATKEYLPQLEALKAGIEAADAQAHDTQLEQEKNYDQISSSHSANVASVIAFYDGLLRKARNKASPVTVTINPEVPDGTPSEPRACEPDIEFTRDCALDAIKILGFQDWVRVNQIPVK